MPHSLTFYELIVNKALARPRALAQALPLYPYTPTPTPTPYPYPYGTPTGAWSSRRCVHSKALLLVKRWQ